MNIPLNKAYITGKEKDYVLKVIDSGRISGNGIFTNKCQDYFHKKYGYKKCLLTTSCTDALEMAALLIGILPGDEVIMPAYTFVSTANAFMLRGARIKFADSEQKTPNLDLDSIEKLITNRTKALVVVHYAGIANDMEKLMKIARSHRLVVIEDAALSLDSYYKGVPLGSFGDMSTFSFHETKNVTSGEGGMLVINNKKYIRRAEIIWEKGTNRESFLRGEIDKYNWVDIGSSFLPSEMTAAFLFAQLENLDRIQKKRVKLWDYYYKYLKPLEERGFIGLPYVPDYAAINGHIFYILCRNPIERTALIGYLKKHDITAVFHYQALHRSPFYSKKHDGRNLPNADRFTNKLLRLPIYYELELKTVRQISNLIKNFYKAR